MAFGQSNSPKTTNLFSSTNSSLPSGGFQSMGQNTPFQGNQPTQSAFVYRAYGPTSNTSTSGVAGTVSPFGVAATVPPIGVARTVPPFSVAQTVPPFGVAATVPPFGVARTVPTSNTTTSGVAGTVPPFGVARTVPPFGVAGTVPPFGVAATVPPFGVARTVPPFGVAQTVSPFGVTSEKVFETPSTSVFPSSSTAFPTGQLSEPSGISLFGPIGSPTFTPPSTTFPFRPSRSQAFTPEQLSQPVRNPFGPSSSPALTTGQLSQPSTKSPFGPSSSQAFTPGQLSQPSRTSPFGPLSSPAITTGQLSQPSTNSPFGISSSPAFTPGQLSQPSRTSPFGPSSSLTFPTNQSPFQATIVPSEAAQTMRSPNGNSLFVQSTVSGMHGGTRVAAYARTAHTDNASTQARWLTSISAMPTYRKKSHEELKWEDYQIKDKDKVLNPPMHSTSLNSPFSTIPSNIFTPNSTISGSQNSFLYPGFFPPKSSVSQPLSSPAFVPFSINSNVTQPLPNPTFLPFSTNSTVSQPLSSPAFVPFSTNSTVSQPLTSPAFVPFSTYSNVSQPLSSPTFLPFSTNSTVSQPLSSSAIVPFSTNTGFPNNQTCTPSLTPATFPISNICNVPSTEVARNFVPVSQPLCPTCNQVNPGQPAPFIFNFIQTTQNGEKSEAIPKTSSASNSFETLSRVANQNIFSQVSSAPVTEEKQPSHVISPFETLIAAVPQLSFDRHHTASPIQHGISSMPVTNKPTSVKISTRKTTRYLSQGRIKLPVRKYNPKTDGQKVPFFSEEELPRPPNADTYFNPRDNARSWIAGAKFKADKSLPVENGINSVNNTGNTDNCIEEHMGNLISRLNITHDGAYDIEYTSINLTNRESCNTTVAQEQETDVKSLMPKLENGEYYTEPSIENLAAMEKAEPGFCSRVKDFVVGKHTYGYIKFPGETDVRKLDLESTIQFNNREVIVYKDDSKRPPVGEGLNKFAEVTLLNVTCLDKKTGKPCMDEAKIDKYKALLTKKAKEQGAEFLSFNPARGEWKFCVPHFG